MDYHLLKEKYGTPLYVYDVDYMTNVMRLYKENFKSDLFETEVIYASKAFCVKEMLRLVKREGLSLDTVSLGELATAKVVDFDFSKVYFHGNNKSKAELICAISTNVGNIVVDNLMELELLEELLKDYPKKVNILIRLNLGVEAHTHKFIVTAHVDSKFGVLYNSDDYLKMLEICKSSNKINLIGFHSHIGSQIFDLEAFNQAIKKMVNICKDFDYPLVLNLGGGFGVHYTDEDKPVPFNEVSRFLINCLETAIKENNVCVKKVCIEPGRSIVAEAGSTLYTIGFTKQTPNKLYYFIDGGMTDNIRPALYQAMYSAEIVGKENVIKKNVVSIAGKCCESGDVIIENILLPEAKTGDLLVTYSTGAYGYSMSSNYNKALTPAVVFVENGVDRLAVERQTLEQLMMREI